MKMAKFKTAQICDPIVCAIQIGDISFALYDINGIEITEADENSLVFLKGITVHASASVYILDSKTKTNIGYGMTDLVGNFNIPIFLIGTDSATGEMIDLTAVAL